MTDEEKYLLQQEMQRQHILNAGGLGLPMPNNAQMPNNVDGTMRLSISPPFDTGTVSGNTGGMGVYAPGTPQPMNLGQGSGNPRMFPQQLQPQAMQQPQTMGNIQPRPVPPLSSQLTPQQQYNQLRKNKPPLTPPNMAAQKIGRDNIRIMPDGSVAMGMGKGIRPDDSRIGGMNPQGRPSKVFTPTPIPPPQSVPIEGLVKHPSRWDMIKEKMFAGEDQQGLFGKAGINPKTGQDSGSMGLSGYFGRLFNDPARMAMLSGGLTMLDPNSYYDKEGFGSPWTGLKSGLGGAQTGYKSVIDRRKAEAETAKLKAEAGMVGSAQDPTDYRSFLKSQKDGYTGTYQKWLDRKWGRQSGIVPPQNAAKERIYVNKAKYLDKALPDAEASVNGLRMLMESKKYLDSNEGIISGSGADIIAGFHNFLSNRLGFNMGDKFKNTRAFAASMGTQVGQVIHLFGAGTGLSDADRVYAMAIAGGDIEQDEDTIRELMRMQEIVYRSKIKDFRKNADPFNKTMGEEGLVWKLNTEGLDLESKTDWSRKDRPSSLRDPRIAAFYKSKKGLEYRDKIRKGKAEKFQKNQQNLRSAYGY